MAHLIDKDDIYSSYMTYKQLAEYIMSLPAEIQRQEAYLELPDEGTFSVNAISLGETTVLEESHIALNTATREFVTVIDREGTHVNVLKFW